MSILVTTDSSCDLSDTLLKHYHVEKFPLTIVQGGKSYKDGIEIKPENIYQFVANGGTLPSTSAINVIDYQSRFSELSPKFDAVIHISLGSDFSSCHFNAKLAAEDFPNVYVADSRNLSGGQGQVLLEACLLAKQNLPPDEIVARLQQFIPTIEFSFILDQVTYLYKGGRCSGVAALGANLLHLKPMIDLSEGTLSVAKKYRGSFEKVLVHYLQEQLKDRTDIQPERVVFVSTGCPVQWVELACGEIERLTGYPPISCSTAGCTISSHCGPKTLGIAFLKK